MWQKMFQQSLNAQVEVVKRAFDPHLLLTSWVALSAIPASPSLHVKDLQFFFHLFRFSVNWAYTLLHAVCLVSWCSVSSLRNTVSHMRRRGPWWMQKHGLHHPCTFALWVGFARDTSTTGSHFDLHCVHIGSGAHDDLGTERGALCFDDAFFE